MPWVLLDQAVVHLSLNHASLPQIHIFRNLQSGLAVSRITAAENSVLGTATKPTYVLSDSKSSITVTESATRSGRFSRLNPLRSKTGGDPVSQMKDLTVPEHICIYNPTMDTRCRRMYLVATPIRHRAWRMGRKSVSAKARSKKVGRGRAIKRERPVWMFP